MPTEWPPFQKPSSVHDLRPWLFDVTSLLIGNVENNENNTGQKYPLQGVTGFNQVLIKLQLILTITICDYDEEKYDDKDTRPNFQHGLPSGHPA